MDKEDLEFYSQLQNHAVRVTGVVTLLVKEVGVKWMQEDFFPRGVETNRLIPTTGACRKMFQKKGGNGVSKSTKNSSLFSATI